MKIRKILHLIILTIFTFTAFKADAVTFDDYYPNPDERPTESIVLKSGTLLKVMCVRGINTFTGDIGDECEFINTSDMFVGEFNVLPKNSHVYGVIEDIREPVQGNNAAIKIKINKLVTPDLDTTYYLDGYIGGGADFYIGGEQTAPVYYKATPSYNEGWGNGILQMNPLNIYAYGKHTQIKAGQEVFVILVKDLKIN
ncbi:MAG: hypothetical protein K6C94_06250 [Candidatus Gastranaerophilales bacterium]|nr:hypothetical protein [Candidatus Gastranaerophilales bacterium]